VSVYPVVLSHEHGYYAQNGPRVSFAVNPLGADEVA
jgi:hypothetical protein